MHPNHYMDVYGLHKDELRSKLKILVQDRDKIVAPKNKISVASFQLTPTGMCPYLILVGIPQTINDRNKWGEEMLTACVFRRQRILEMMLYGIHLLVSF